MSLASDLVVPGQVAIAWSFDPPVLVALIVISALYAWGVARIWHRAGVGRGVSVNRVGCFAGGIVATFIALVSPIDRLGETLFSAHMVQHLILMLVAAPLFAASSPLLPTLLALGPRVQTFARRIERSRIGSFIARSVKAPAVVFVLSTLALWGWHMPGPYRAALENPWIHALEHASFVGTSMLFWWLILTPAGRKLIDRGAAIFFVFVSGMPAAALGALLTFATVKLYPIHEAGVRLWHTTLLHDQQMAGLIMWIPAGVLYIGTAAALFLRWMAAEASGGSEDDKERKLGWLGEH
ncbi:MAG: cytochrome c oxidase assembly protein [Actinomycetota bacterium]